MSIMKGIDLTLSEMVEELPNLVADYDLDFYDNMVRVIQLHENGNVKEIYDHKEIQTILKESVMLEEHCNFHFDLEEESFYKLTIHQNGIYPFAFLSNLIVLPAYYNDGYYKILLDVGLALK